MKKLVYALEVEVPDQTDELVVEVSIQDALEKEFHQTHAMRGDPSLEPMKVVRLKLEETHHPFKGSARYH